MSFIARHRNNRCIIGRERVAAVLNSLCPQCVLRLPRLYLIVPRYAYEFDWRVRNLLKCSAVNWIWNRFASSLLPRFRFFVNRRSNEFLSNYIAVLCYHPTEPRYNYQARTNRAHCVRPFSYFRNNCGHCVSLNIPRSAWREKLLKFRGIETLVERCVQPLFNATKLVHLSTKLLFLGRPF